MGREPTWTRKYVHLCVAGLISLSLFGCGAYHERREEKEAYATLRYGQELLARGDYEGAFVQSEKLVNRFSLKPPEDEALFTMGLIYAHFGNPKKDHDQAVKCFVRVVNDYPNSRWADQARVWIGVFQEQQTIHQALQQSKRAVEEARQQIEQLEKAKKVEKPAEESVDIREPFPQTLKLLAQGDYDGALAEGQKMLSVSLRRAHEDEALFNLALVYAHAGNPKKDQGKSLEIFKRLIKDHPKSPLAEQARIWVSVLQENEDLTEMIERWKQIDIEIERKKREKKK